MRTLGAPQAGMSVGGCIKQATAAFCQLNMMINLSSRTGSGHLGWSPVWQLLAYQFKYDSEFTWIGWSFATGCQRGGHLICPPCMLFMRGKQRAYAFALSIGLSQLARHDERGFSALVSQSIEERARPRSSKQHMLKAPLSFVEAHDWRASGLI